MPSVNMLRLPAATVLLPRRVGGLAAAVLALTPGLLPAEESETRYAWNGSKFELAITLGDGNDHEFQFRRLAAAGDTVVYHAVARGPATGKLVFQENVRADETKPVRIEFQIGEKEIVVSAAPTTLLDGTELDLAGTYRIVSASR